MWQTFSLKLSTILNDFCIFALKSTVNKKMTGERTISHKQIVLAFVSTCIEATARTLGVSYFEVFKRMQRLGMIKNYIYPNYETLHTESRENIALDMIECMKLWEDRK